jgi:putative transposase
MNKPCLIGGKRGQRESFDRIVRDEEHLWRVVQYIGANPRRAGLLVGETSLWIRPEWVELGWRFEDVESVD